MSHRHHVPSSDEWLAEHMQEINRLLHVLALEIHATNERLEKLIDLLSSPGTYPQATDARVDSS